MKHLAPALILAAVVSGCALQPKVVSTTPRSVQVFAGNLADAMPLAQAECARHGRHAKWARGDDTDSDFVFDCVN